MRLYELVLIFKSSLSEAQRKKIIDSIKSMLKDAKISKEEDWGKKALSYPIRREQDGYYSYIEAESNSSVAPDFEKKILANENILRHLLVRKK